MASLLEVLFELCAPTVWLARIMVACVTIVAYCFGCSISTGEKYVQRQSPWTCPTVLGYALTIQAASTVTVERLMWLNADPETKLDSGRQYNTKDGA